MGPQKADVALRSSEWNMGSRSAVRLSLSPPSLSSLFFALFLSRRLSFSFVLSRSIFFSSSTCLAGFCLRFPINGRVLLHDPHHRALSTVMVFRPLPRPWRRVAARRGTSEMHSRDVTTRRCVMYLCACVCCVCCVKWRGEQAGWKAGGIRENARTKARYCREIMTATVRK